MYLPNPSDYIQAIDAVTGELKWEYKREYPADLGKFIPFPSINRNIAIVGRQDCGHQRRRFPVCLGRGDRQARVGNAHRRLSRDSRAGDRRSHRREREDLLHARVRGEVLPRRMRDHRARCCHRKGTMEDSHDSEAGRTGRRILGRHAGCEAPPCRRLDGAELRSRTEPAVSSGRRSPRPRPSFSSRETTRSTCITIPRSR